MATLSIPFPVPRRVNPWPWLLLAVGVVVALCAHAKLHRSAPDVAYTCNRNGPTLTLRNPTNGFTAMLCKMPNGLYGRVVSDEKGENLTAFGGEDAKRDTLEKAIQNIYRGGFREIINPEKVASDLMEKIVEILARMGQ